MIDFKIVTTSDQESKPIKYYLSLKNWDPRKLGVQINFAQPLMVGRGGDSIMAILKNPSLFIAKATGLSISPDKATSAKIAPTQMAEGVSEEDLNTEAKVSKNAVFAITATQVVAQLYLNNSITQLFGMFFTLQIIICLSVYAITIPSNSEIYRS